MEYDVLFFHFACGITLTIQEAEDRQVSMGMMKWLAIRNFSRP